MNTPQQQQRETALASEDPLRATLDMGGIERDAMAPAGVSDGFAMIGSHQGSHTGGDIITAQRVAVPRSTAKVMASMKALAAAAGKNYVYGWEVKEKSTGRKTWIEGPTIKLANDLARTYGNCMVNVRVVDAGASWMMYGRFVDLETGFTTERAYQQRKSQNVGMSDNQRASDMVFQIGQSKCIRNVIVNALQTFADYAVDEAKGALLARVASEPGKARAWIIAKLKEINVEVKHVEAIYGRTSEHWTNPDMARIYTEIQSVLDGMMNAAEVYPAPVTEETVKTDDKKGKTGVAPKGDAKTKAVPASQAGDSKVEDAKGSASQPEAPLAASGASGAASSGQPEGCPIFLNLDDVPLAHTSDAMLKAGDPITVDKIEYVIESVGARKEDKVPVYLVKLAPPPPAVEPAAPKAPRKSMFKKPA